jgi:hypothetical protein
LLTRYTKDQLVSLVVLSTAEAGQLCFGQDIVNDQQLIAYLSPISKDNGGPGVYTILAKSKFLEQRARYIGCLITLYRRRLQHNNEFKKGSQSQDLYRKINQDTWDIEYCCVSLFKDSLQRHDIEFVESVFMLLANSLNSFKDCPLNPPGTGPAMRNLWPQLNQTSPRHLQLNLVLSIFEVARNWSTVV